jgi:hypothetical protein
MNKILIAAVSMFALAAAISAQQVGSEKERTAASSQGSFCAGFEEGFRSTKGDLVPLPICPIEPVIPIGSTPFREGIKAGIAAYERNDAPAQGRQPIDYSSAVGGFRSADEAYNDSVTLGRNEKKRRLKAEIGRKLATNDCDGAIKIALESGDLDLATQVNKFCSRPN